MKYNTPVGRLIHREPVKQGFEKGQEFYADITRLLQETLAMPWLKLLGLNETGAPTPEDLELGDYTDYYEYAEDQTILLIDDENYDHRLYDYYDSRFTGGWDEACRYSTRLFSTWRALWQCMALATLSIAQASLTGLHSSVNQDIESTISYFNGNATGFYGPGVLETVVGCLSQSFPEADVPSSEDLLDFLATSWSITYDPSAPGPLWDGDYNAPEYNWLQSLCQEVPMETISDVFGPGVSISYYIQTVLVIFLWLSLRLSTLRSTFNYVVGSVPALRNRYEKLQMSNTPIANLFRRLEHSRFTHVSKTIVKEFQEAQCFFMLCIEIALAYSSSKKASVSTISNWRSYEGTGRMLSRVLSRGAACLVLIQIMLLRLDSDFFYYLVLSTAGVILAHICEENTVKLNYDLVYWKFREDGDSSETIAECGGGPSLETYCGGTSAASWDATSHDIFISAVPFRPLHAIIALLWVNKLLKEALRTRWTERKLSSCSQGARLTWSRAKFIVPRLQSLCFVAAELYFLLYFLDNLAGKVSSTSGNWSVGQVISLLVWAPVISKYLYLTVRGMQEGYKIRISEGYELRKKGDGAPSTLPIDRRKTY